MHTEVQLSQHALFLTPTTSPLNVSVPAPGLRMVMRNYNSPGLLAPSGPHLSPWDLPQSTAPDGWCLHFGTDPVSPGDSWPKKINGTSEAFCLPPGFLKIRFEPIAGLPAEMHVVHRLVRWSSCPLFQAGPLEGQGLTPAPMVKNPWCWGWESCLEHPGPSPAPCGHHPSASAGKHTLLLVPPESPHTTPLSTAFRVFSCSTHTALFSNQASL